MFTGIIEETGRLLSFTKEAIAYRLVLSASIVLEDIALGDSIAVNGCCLTVVDFDEKSIAFDLLEESVRLTSIGALKEGDPVNLERSLRYNGKIGGHFVSGHVDGLGKVIEASYKGTDLYLKIKPPIAFMKYLAYKGSITIDGISLTVAEVHPDSFAVWLIPHTLQVTNLKTKKSDSVVNLEFDLLAKYVEQLMPGQRKLNLNV